MQCITRSAGINPRAPSGSGGTLVQRLAAAAAGPGLGRAAVRRELAAHGFDMVTAPSQVKQLAIAAWHRHEWLRADLAVLARRNRLCVRSGMEEVDCD